VCSVLGVMGLSEESRSLRIATFIMYTQLL
jgi:hypothetical protein